MIVLMAGLPGSGKSTLALELSKRTAGLILDKDNIREALFGPNDVEYSTEQDDFCQELMLECAAYLFRKDAHRVVFLDGRPFSRRYQLEQGIEAAEALGQPWRILECICSEETARRRLEAQPAEHPARNRNYSLYLEVKARFAEITFAKTLIDTDEPLEDCTARALRALSS